MKNFTFSCPVTGCSDKFTVSAENEEEAIKQLKIQAEAHRAAVHNNLQFSEEEFDALVKTNTKAVEATV